MASNGAPQAVQLTPQTTKDIASVDMKVNTTPSESNLERKLSRALSTVSVRDERYKDPNCTRKNPGFWAEVIGALLIGWALMAGFYVALYFIGLAVRGDNFLVNKSSRAFNYFDQASMPSAYGTVPAENWPGAGPNFPNNCPLVTQTEGLACGAVQTGGIMSMFPWIEDKLTGPLSPMPGCVKAKATLGYFMDVVSFRRCINGVSKVAMLDMP